MASRSPLTDCNGDGSLDGCDIQQGLSSDANNNGIPDECEAFSCPGDTDDDGVVGVLDLLNVLVSWIFGCPPPEPFVCGDVNGDGDITFADLLMVFANWGPCS